MSSFIISIQKITLRLHETKKTSKIVLIKSSVASCIYSRCEVNERDKNDRDNMNSTRVSLLEITGSGQPFPGDGVSVYRVAQNKIPHQTMCNISATSGLISKICEAA